MQQAATSVPTDATVRPLFSRNYRAWLLFMLLLTNALNLADRIYVLNNGHIVDEVAAQAARGQP